MNNPDTPWKQNFQKQLSGYKRPGTGLAWAEVEAAALSARRKRYALYWLGAASVAAASVIFFVTIFNRTEPGTPAEKLLATSQETEIYVPEGDGLFSMQSVPETDAGRPVHSRILPAIHPASLELTAHVDSVDGTDGAGPASSTPSDLETDRKPQESVVPESTGKAVENVPAVGETDILTDPDWEEDPSWEREQTPLRVSTALYIGNGIGTAQMNRYESPLLQSAPLFNKQMEGYQPMDFKPMLNNANSMNSYEKHDLPVRYGLAVSFGLTDRFSLGTGTYFTMLHSRFGYDFNHIQGEETRQRLFYAGLPLNATWRFAQLGGHFYAYTNLGGLAEVLLDGRRTTRLKYEMGERTEKIHGHPVQFSVNAALGLGVKIINGLSLYAEPGLSYYFKNTSEIQSYYTDKPLSFSLNLGFRWDL